MLSIGKQHTGKKYNEARFDFFCLSTDTKPTESYNDVKILNGSSAKEIDTGDEYLYDETGKTWHQQP